MGTQRPTSPGPSGARTELQMFDLQLGWLEIFETPLNQRRRIEHVRRPVFQCLPMATAYHSAVS